MQPRRWLGNEGSEKDSDCFSEVVYRKKIVVTIMEKMVSMSMIKRHPRPNTTKAAIWWKGAKGAPTTTNHKVRASHLKDPSSLESHVPAVPSSSILTQKRRVWEE
jgi:hypothetical protein